MFEIPYNFSQHIYDGLPLQIVIVEGVHVFVVFVISGDGH